MTTRVETLTTGATVTYTRRGYGGRRATGYVVATDGDYIELQAGVFVHADQLL